MQVNEEYLRDMAKAFQPAAVLLAAYELGVFGIIGEASLNSAEVAKASGTDTRAMDRLLNAICALGILRKKDGLFSNTEASGRFLVSTSEDYMAGLGHTANQFRRWATLTEAVKTGHRVVPGAVEDVENDKATKAFIAAMHHRGKKGSESMLAHLSPANIRKMLDIGGGSGVFTFAFANANPELEAVIMDLPHVVGLTDEYIARAGLSGRVKTMAGDCMKDDLGSGYDLILISAVAHIYSDATNRAFAGRAFAALNPGGRLVIRDFFMNEDRVTPAHSALFALNMLVSTEEGDTYTQKEVEAWLEGAGFSGIERVGDSGEDFIVGVKPL